MVVENDYLKKAGCFCPFCNCMVSDLQTSLYISLRWDQDAMAHTAATLARMYGDFAAKTEIVEYMFSQVKVFVSRPVFFFGHRPECF